MLALLIGMGPVKLTRWTKPGQDRLYVRGVAGAQVGWVDLRTGTAHRDNPEGWTPEVDLAVDDWLQTNGRRPATSAPEPRPTGPAPQVRPEPIIDVPAATSEPVHAVVEDLAAAATAAPEPPAPAASRRTSTAPRGWVDLAKNRAGSSAQEAARARTNGWRRVGRAIGVRTKDQSWRTGAAGERKVGRTLRVARIFGWRVLHSVPVGQRGADIDHVLIGPGGVVTVNAKHHKGKAVKAGRDAVLVGGRAERYAQSSQYEATRAARLLSTAAGKPVEVTPVVVVVGARWVRGRRTQGVRILTRSGLPGWLLIRRRRLNRAARRALFDVARRSTTWQPHRAS